MCGRAWVRVRRFFYVGQGPDPNCRSVAVVGSRVKRVWSGCGGGPAFFYVGQGPDPNCRRVAVVGSRVKLVWSGLDAGPFFGAQITNVGATIGRPRILHRKIHRRQANKNRASPQRRPNIIILSQPRFIVNYQSAKNRGFSLLYHLFGSYLLDFPSCKSP